MGKSTGVRRTKTRGFLSTSFVNMAGPTFRAQALFDDELLKFSKERYGNHGAGLGSHQENVEQWSYDASRSLSDCSSARLTVYLLRVVSKFQPENWEKGQSKLNQRNLNRPLTPVVAFFQLATRKAPNIMPHLNRWRLNNFFSNISGAYLKTVLVLVHLHLF